MFVRTTTFCVLSAVGAAQTIGPNFTSHYTYVNLGTPTVPLSWGGVNFVPGNPNALLLAGHAFSSTGEIWQVPVVRGAGGHIVGLAGGDSLVSSAPNVDGGVTIAPGNVILFTSWPSNTLGQIKAGSTAPDRTDDLTALGVASSTGGACIVPAGFAGAGRLKVTSYGADMWYDMTLTPDGNGTFQPSAAGAGILLPGTGFGGTEGITYVHGGSSGFAVDSVVIAEYGEWQLATYAIDANGDPIAATRDVLLDNLPTMEGVVLDPLTGDFVVVAQNGTLALLERQFVPPTTYCTAGTTTNNCVPSIAGVGTPSGSAGSGFTIQVSGVEGQKQGILFYGISGQIATPWGLSTSFLCVKAPTQRATVQNSGGTTAACNGTLSMDWNAFIAANPGALGTPFTGGEVVQAQAWFRDPPSPKTTNLSNGLEFTVAP